MRLYKLTDEKDQTYNKTQWGEGVSHQADGQGDLCGPGWIHATTHPLLAVLLNPIQGNYDLVTAHLWEGEGEVGKEDYGLKVGCTQFTTLRRLPLPTPSLEQRVRFAILCACQVYKESTWQTWAQAWLDGSNRTQEAAWAVGEAAWAAAGAAARAAREAEPLNLVSLAEEACKE